MEDGRPFCPQCRAPQIHVQVVVAEGEAAGAVSAAVGNATETPSIRLPQVTDFGHSREVQAGLFDRRAAVRAALQAGALGGLVGMFIPLLGLVLAASFAVYLFRREKGFVLGARVGGRVGGAAGVVFFAINYVLWLIQVFALHGRQEYIEKVQKVWQAIGVNPADPEIQASIQNVFTPAGLVIMFVGGMLFAAAAAALVGAVAAWMMRPHSRP